MEDDSVVVAAFCKLCKILACLLAATVREAIWTSQTNEWTDLLEEHDPSTTPTECHPCLFRSRPIPSRREWEAEMCRCQYGGVTGSGGGGRGQGRGPRFPTSRRAVLTQRHNPSRALSLCHHHPPSSPFKAAPTRPRIQITSRIDVYSHASHRPAGRLGLSNRYVSNFLCS